MTIALSDLRVGTVVTSGCYPGVEFRVEDPIPTSEARALRLARVADGRVNSSEFVGCLNSIVSQPQDTPAAPFGYDRHPVGSFVTINDTDQSYHSLAPGQAEVIPAQTYAPSNSITVRGPSRYGTLPVEQYVEERHVTSAAPAPATATTPDADLLAFQRQVIDRTRLAVGRFGLDSRAMDDYLRNDLGLGALMEPPAPVTHKVTVTFDVTLPGESLTSAQVREVREWVLAANPGSSDVIVNAVYNEYDEDEDDDY